MTRTGGCSKQRRQPQSRSGRRRRRCSRLTSRAWPAKLRDGAAQVLARGDDDQVVAGLEHVVAVGEPRLAGPAPADDVARLEPLALGERRARAARSRVRRSPRRARGGRRRSTRPRPRRAAAPPRRCRGRSRDRDRSRSRSRTAPWSSRRSPVGLAPAEVGIADPGDGRHLRVELLGAHRGDQVDLVDLGDRSEQVGLARLRSRAARAGLAPLPSTTSASSSPSRRDAARRAVDDRHLVAVGRRVRARLMPTSPAPMTITRMC